MFPSSWLTPALLESKERDLMLSTRRCCQLHRQAIAFLNQKRHSRVEKQFCCWIKFETSFNKFGKGRFFFFNYFFHLSWQQSCVGSNASVCVRRVCDDVIKCWPAIGGNRRRFRAGAKLEKWRTAGEIFVTMLQSRSSMHTRAHRQIQKWKSDKIEENSKEGDDDTTCLINYTKVRFLHTTTPSTRH